ncbi:MAG: hypothetical protein EBR82_10015 [Caulobacteraceae bacterium]|nr:hypothetical protein [Caulobacteraceae bacterium]
MATLKDIRVLLEKRLDIMTGNYPIAYENFNYKPTEGATFIKCAVVHTSSRPATLGPNAGREMRGLFFIDLFYPRDKGPQLADTIVDSILEQFKAGTVLTETGLSTIVNVRFCERRGSALDFDGWYQIPITVEWFCFE